MSDDACLACDLTDGREALPGGVIRDTGSWRVEHCVGPLGLGTLIVKPLRHVTAVADLTDDEAAELGPLLRAAAAVAGGLRDAEQVYTCLWSHADAKPGHLHFVVQPVTTAQMAEHAAYGPALQMAMFNAGQHPPADAVEAFADRARAAFAVAR